MLPRDITGTHPASVAAANFPAKADPAARDLRAWRRVTAVMISLQPYTPDSDAQCRSAAAHQPLVRWTPAASTKG